MTIHYGDAIADVMRAAVTEKAILDAWTSELIRISFVRRNVLEGHVDDGRGNWASVLSDSIRKITGAGTPSCERCVQFLLNCS